MKTIFYYLMLVICALVFSSCVNNTKKYIDESIETDSIEQWQHVPTVHDILVEREEWKRSKYVDSVYLNMPEQILVQMLVAKGTTISVDEIVEDYLANKQFYHDTILKSMDIQKKYLPDSLPTPSKPDKEKEQPQVLSSSH